MPTYEYECTKCGAVVEISHSMTEPARKKLKKDDPKPCACGAAVQRRIGTGAGVIFKGTGFYTTDYRSESYKNAAKADRDAASGPKDSPADKSTSSESSSEKKTPQADKPVKSEDTSSKIGEKSAE